MPRKLNTAKAHRIRRERAEILLGVERGTVHIVDVIYAPPDCLKGADLYPVLMRVPKLGRSGIKRICQRSRVWPHEKMGELKEHERLRLVTCLPARVKENWDG